MEMREEIHVLKRELAKAVELAADSEAKYKACVLDPVPVPVHSAELAQLRDDVARTKAALHDATHCVVCMDRPRERMLMPCSHFAFCTPCVADVKHCPLCNQAPTGHLRVYNS